MLYGIFLVKESRVHTIYIFVAFVMLNKKKFIYICIYIYIYIYIYSPKDLIKQKDGEPNTAKTNEAVDSSSCEQGKSQSLLARLSTTLSEIFCMKNITESYNVAFKKRKGGIRHIVVLLIFMFSMYMLVGMGIGLVGFPYVKLMFTWESTEYLVSWWSTYNSVTVRQIYLYTNVNGFSRIIT